MQGAHLIQRLPVSNAPAIGGVANVMIRRKPEIMQKVQEGARRKRRRTCITSARPPWPISGAAVGHASSTQGRASQRQRSPTGGCFASCTSVCLGSYMIGRDTKD